VPPKPIRQLRDLTRLRRTLIEERSGYRQRTQKLRREIRSTSHATNPGWILSVAA